MQSACTAMEQSAFHGNATNKPAMVVGLDRLRNNLGELLTRVEELSRRVHGPRPKPPTDDSRQTGAPVSHVSSIEQLNQMAERISGVLDEMAESI